MASLRLFVAVSLSDEMKERLNTIVQKASTTPSGVKWVRPPHFHLTLAFLGNQEEGLLSSLFNLFQSAAKGIPIFRLKFGGLGGFPTLNRPKVLFVPVQDGQEPLKSLAGQIIKNLRQGKVHFDEKEFHGHVTIGRVKTSQGLSETIEMLRANLPPDLGTIDVDRFLLFKSQLTSEGPIYQALKEFPLAGVS